MRGSRHLAWFAAIGLCAGLIGCVPKGPQDGGAGGRRPDKARKDAEIHALSAVHGAADALAKADPALKVERPRELPPDQVREQRAQERLPSAVRGLGGLVAVALAGFLFLRLDRRTKGALTVWLALAAIALAAGGVAAAVLA